MFLNHKTCFDDFWSNAFCGATKFCNNDATKTTDHHQKHCQNLTKTITKSATKFTTQLPQTFPTKLTKTHSENIAKTICKTYLGNNVQPFFDFWWLCISFLYQCAKRPQITIKKPRENDIIWQSTTASNCNCWNHICHNLPPPATICITSPEIIKFQLFNWCFLAPLPLLTISDHKNHIFWRNGIC